MREYFKSIYQSWLSTTDSSHPILDPKARPLDSLNKLRIMFKQERLYRQKVMSNKQNALKPKRFNITL